MKVLLINPSHRDPEFPLLPKLVFSEKGLLPPIGLLYIASYILKNSSHEVKVIDMQINKFDLKGLYYFVKDYKPDVVGIASYTPIFYSTYEIARMVKEIDSKIHINVGGPHTELYPEETLQSRYIDSITFREGEYVFLDLLNALSDKRDLSRVRGIGYKKDNNCEIVINEGTQLIRDLDCLPFPDRALLPSDSNYLVLNKKSRTTTMISSRGCPYNCSYCANLTKVFRQRSPENVISEMTICKEQGYDFIQFYDATFNVSQKFVKEFCKKLYSKKLGLRWGFTGRPELLTRELIEMLKESGCERIHMGIESIVGDTNKFFNRNFNDEIVQNVFKWCKRFKIETVAYFIIGSPYDTAQDIRRTVKFAKKLSPDFAQFFVLIPLPGTKIYHDALQKKVFKNDYFRDYIKNPIEKFEVKIWEGILTKEDISKLIKYAYRKFYFRPYYMWLSIKKLNSLKEFIIKIRGARVLLFYIFRKRIDIRNVYNKIKFWINKSYKFIILFLSKIIFKSHINGEWIYEKYQNPSSIFKILINLLYYKLKSTNSYKLVSLCIEITNNCNLRCKICPIGQGNLTRERGFISFDTIKRITEGIPDVESITLANIGEPVLHPEIIEIIKFLKSSSKRVILFTNGLAVDEDLLNRMFTAGLDVLTFSIDGIENTYDNIRGISYENIRDKILMAISLRNKMRASTEIKISVTLNHETQQDINKLIEYWEYKVDAIKFIPLRNLNGNGKTRCYQFWRGELTVLWDGRVIPCCFDVNADIYIGDVYNEPLNKIWNGERLMTLRKEFLEGKRKFPCTHCYETPVLDFFAKTNNSPE